MDGAKSKTTTEEFSNDNLDDNCFIRRAYKVGGSEHSGDPASDKTTSNI